MKENKLIASVVVFKELFNNNKDIYDIIAEFIKAAILDKKKWTFSSTELKQLLQEIFDFKLPEAVVKSTLKNRLVKTGFLSQEKGVYTVNDLKQKVDPIFEQNYISKKEIYRKTEEEFIDFVQQKRNRTFGKTEKEKIRENIGHYLLGNGINEPYTSDISEYIISRKRDTEFLNRLNVVKEGFVLYTGVRYTADLNELGTWKNKLTIFLDTEIIFYFFGYNGEVYEEIFHDFLKLVREINQQAKPGNKTIELKFFEETEQEIINFFHVASLIVEGKATLNPGKTAMKEIVNGCSTKSDVLVKRNKLFINLQTSGIEKEESRDYYENHDFNVEGTQVLEELANSHKDSKRDFDEDYCKNNLKLFTKINVLRKGRNNVSFEQSRFILLTGNRYIHYLAHNNQIKNNEKDIPFATDIDFLTDKFWFKLKKGFGTSEDVPKVFDMITKAQIVLSSQISSTVQEKFTALIEQFNKGDISKEEAISLTYSLRENSLKPEEINESNIKNSLAFINEFSIDDHIREREILNQKVSEGVAAKKELKKRDRLDRTKKNKKLKSKLIWIKSLAYLVPFLCIIIFYFFLYLLISFFKSDNDSILTIAGFVLAICALIPFYSALKKYYKWLSSKIQRNFEKNLSRN